MIFLLLQSGYFEQALRIAERFVDLDPLSASAHSALYEALKSNGRRAEALSSLKVSAQLGFSYGVWELGNFYLEEGRDEMAIEQFESVMRERDLPSEWIRELVVGARDPETGQTHLDQLLSQLEVPLPFGVGPGYSRFYLAMGFLDRYFEEIFELGVFDAEWSPAENLIYYGTIDRKSGFTAHPKYLEVAEDFGLFELWNQRGPPDHCEKLDGKWACE